MELKFKNFLSRSLLIIMLSGAVFFCETSVKAAKVSDTGSPLEYVCFSGAITAWLRGTDVEDWKSAAMKDLGSQTAFEFTRKGWIGRIELPNDIALFPEKLSLKIFGNIVDSSKEIILDKVVIEGQEEKISRMSFCCSYENDFLDVNFSYPDRTVQLFSKTRNCSKVFRLEDDEYSLKQVFALEMSLIIDYILD